MAWTSEWTNTRGIGIPNALLNHYTTPVIICHYFSTFIFNDKIICYADASTYESNNTILRDLSGKGNDLYFSSIPSGSMDNGYIELQNTKITGFPSNIINQNSFTIFMIIFS